MKLKKAFLVLVGLLWLSGCTSLGSHVLSNPSTYFSENLLPLAPEDLNIETRQYCGADSQSCYSYLYAKSYKPTDFPEGGNVFYNIHAVGNGVENHISYRAMAAGFNRINGTAVLIHGFGGSKEVMMATAIYFRSIGMSVVIPDLHGHGDSQQPFVFGAKEHTSINAILRQLESNADLKGPVVAVGHSMGALPATNLLVASEYVDGAILLAPMTRFDQSSKAYFAGKAPVLNRFLASSMDEIVATSMAQAGVTLADTDIASKLAGVSKPVLVVNSDVDAVSPPGYFAHLHQGSLQVVKFPQRSHGSLIAFDNEDSGVIENWLMQFQDAAQLN